MVRLTEEMVAARTRSSDCASVKKLNCWGTELTDVSILRKMKKVEVLSLSVNNIKTLSDFQNCLDLKDLFVRKNNILDLNEVCYLQGLPKLRNLWLGENPCAEIDGYRMAVLKALPHLEKLDDKIVTPEELQTAVSKGKNLVHPLSNHVTEQPQYPPENSECTKYEDQDAGQGENYSSSDEPCEESPQTADEYQDNDEKNANYNNSSMAQHPSSNRYIYEQNGRVQQTDDNIRNSSYNEDPVASNVLELSQDYERAAPPSRSNGDYEDSNQRAYINSPRVAYQQPQQQQHQQEYDDRKIEYEDCLRLSSGQSRRGVYQQSFEREDVSNQSPAWVKRSENEKRRTHFQQQFHQRRPVTRNSNILSAVLCLVKELDYPSLEVVEMTVRNRMDELEE